MGRYRLTRNYASKTLGPWLIGEIVDLSDEDAQRIENAAPGTLEYLGRAMDAPPRDRMIRTTLNRGRRNGR